jgi:hypothetical protein
MQGDRWPEPGRPQWNTLLIIALFAIATAATAVETRPDLPPVLKESLTVFGSVLIGCSILYPMLISGRD